MPETMTLDLLKGIFSVARLHPGDAIPPWASGGELLSISRTPDELSIVCSGPVPDGIDCRGGWRCLKVRGPLDFSLTGVLASIAEPLKRAGVPIFAISTFETDYVLVGSGDLETALAALRASGHSVMRPAEQVPGGEMP